MSEPVAKYSVAIHRRVLPVLLAYFLLVGALYSQSVTPPVEINFGADVENPNMMTAREIEIRARSMNLLLLPDDPGRNLQDFLAEGIPSYGMNFELRAPGTGRVYLVLDLVAFEPLEKATDLKVRWMEVFVNGHLLETVHQGGGVFVKSPLVLLIEREHAIDRRLRIQLRPSPGDGFFAIWDAYVSGYGDPGL